MVTSATRLRLPEIDPITLRQMIIDAVEANAEEVPDPPGSLYIRPTLIGTEADIGAAARPTRSALLFVVNSPVGDYFKGGVRPLTLLVETSVPRTVPQFGMVKCGANYAMALGATLDAMAAKRGSRSDCCSPPAATSPRPGPRTSSSPTANGSSPGIWMNRSCTA